MHIGGTGVNNACGQMSITRNGDKIVATRYLAGEIELFDFDINTGFVSNPQLISNYAAAWGAEFSPDGTKLYSTQIGTSNVHQFDLSSGNINNIISSQTLIGSGTGPNAFYKACCLQLGPDNKIYVSKFDSHYLAVINDPNTNGLSCNFVDNGINLGGIPTSKAGLTRCIFPICNTSGFDEQSAGTSIRIYPNPSGTGISINIKETIAGDKLRIELFNSIGEKILEKHIYQNEMLEVNNINDGIYQAAFTIGNKKYFKKIIVIH